MFALGPVRMNYTRLATPFAHARQTLPRSCRMHSVRVRHTERYTGPHAYRIEILASSSTYEHLDLLRIGIRDFDLYHQTECLETLMQRELWQLRNTFSKIQGCSQNLSHFGLLRSTVYVLLGVTGSSKSQPARDTHARLIDICV